jgi:hypothetical protein
MHEDGYDLDFYQSFEVISTKPSIADKGLLASTA